MTAFIGYDNAITRHDLIGASTTETADNPFSNAFDWNLWDTWMPGVVGTAYGYFSFTGDETIDYLAIYGHNIGGLTVYIDMRVGLSWSNVHSFIAGEDTIFERFTPQSDNSWRVRIEGCSGDTFITCISAGQVLQLNPLRVPFAPPPKARNAEVVNNKSVDHLLLGRITRHVPFDLRIDQTIVPTAWVEANSEALIEHINDKPFFFTWDDTKDDACICWTERPVDPPRYKMYGYMEFSIRAMGVR